MGRTIGYASFNKPNSITQGTVNVSFIHDPDHQRLKKIDTNGGTATTTLYLGAGPVYAELVTGGSGTSATWNDYLMAGGEMIGVRFDNISNPLAPVVTTRYFHKDHLGSVAVLTDENANVVQRLSYDPWGRQRNAATWADDTTGVLPTQDVTTRGFTGQEQLADVGLVHLNGRVYDPTLGRFTSADPVVQDPYSAQGLNRYSYVYDNPLSHTDPSGHGFFSFIADVFKDIVEAPIKLAAAILKAAPIVGTIINIATTAIAAIECGPCAIGVAALNASFNAGVTSGSLSVALEAGAIAGVTAAAFFGVGELTAETVNYSDEFGGGSYTTHDLAFGSPDFFANVAGHALVGCASAAASGNGCGSGALAAGVTAFAGPVIDHSDFTFGLVANSALGGVASVIGGGKFENGAITGAFGYLFNAAAGRFVGGIIGGVVAAIGGVESGPADIAIAIGGHLIGGEIGSSIEDWLWGNPDTLQQHFENHGADFGATDPSDYARQAQQFFENNAGALPTKIDPNTGTVRVYDPNTNTFGSYNPDGSTKTYFKPDPTVHGYPSNIDYWNAQPGQP